MEGGLGLPDERIVRIATTSDNFWRMGDTGPCGPCSEIFFDHGDRTFSAVRPDADADLATASSRSGTWCSCSSRKARRAATRVTLPRPSIDTGMGLERLAAILQGKHDNYDIDILRALIRASAEVTGEDPDGPHKVVHRVIADHLRGLRVPDRRRRAAVERGPRLRAPPHHAPRHAPRHDDGRAGSGDVSPGAGAHPPDGRRLSRNWCAPRG